MKSLSFEKDLVGVQEELLRFAYKSLIPQHYSLTLFISA